MSAIYAMKTVANELPRVEAVRLPVHYPNSFSGAEKKVDHRPPKQRESVPKQEIADLQKQTDKLNRIMDIFSRKIRFFVDSKENKVVIKIIDSRSGEVIRQIPPEKMINFVNRINTMIGFVLDEKA
ncbi:MAG: flagellar protein FlaG [Calditrichaeota bacterium]|nr:flagellar protein FlaG [Calditrichota bacterium]